MTGKAALRRLARAALGKGRGDRMVTALGRLGHLDLLVLAYRKLGILNFASMEESGERLFITSLRDAGLFGEAPVLMDVGANQGDYSKELANIFPEARIFAFEPNANTYKKLRTRLETNHNTICVPKGLASAPGTSNLFVYGDDEATPHASQSADVFKSYHRRDDIREMRIDLTTVDQFCADQQLNRIDLLKIDAEGYEYDVLRGASEMIRRAAIDVIQFEFGELTACMRVFLRDFYELLGDYRFYRINVNGLVELGQWRPTHEIFRFQNIVAVRKPLDFPRKGAGLRVPR